MKTNNLIVDSFDKLPSPSYVCEEKLLENNLKLLKRIQDEADVNILLALKGKDGYFLFPKNKLYSPDTCCFIPQEINVSIIKPYKKRELPIGVYKHRNKYVGHIKENKQSKYIGIFNTIEEAHNCYKVNKSKQLVELANKYKDTLTFKVYETLVNYNKNIDKY